MLITGATQKSKKEDSYVNARCQVLQEENSTLWLISLSRGGDTYVNPVTEKSSFYSGMTIACRYKKSQLPKSLEVGSSPSTRAETVVMILGLVILGIFAAIFVIGGALSFAGCLS